MISARAIQTGRHYALLAVAVAAIMGFFDVGRRYADYRLHNSPPAGYELPPGELSFYAWYFLFGGIAVVALTAALATTAAAYQLEALVRRALGSRWWLPGACLILLVEVLATKEFVLQGTPVADDESVYVFIAQTLANMRVVNPPPADPEFFRSTFIVLRDGVWYGKYPIGHPLVLALGELVGLRVLVGPLLGVGTLIATWRVGCRLAGRGAAALAVLLLCCSPQFVATAATEMSQNTGQLVMLLGLLALLRARAEKDARATWMVVAGALMGFGVLVRPLPGALFVLAMAAWVLVGFREQPLAARIRALALGGLPVALFVGIFAWVNHRQTGSPLTTGYHVLHGDQVVLQTEEGLLANSFGAAFLRQWFWAFGWPASFLFLPFAALLRKQTSKSGQESDAAEPSASLAPLWLLLVAGYAYRFVSPKVFVGTTGPIYVAEMVPVIALLSGVGMVRLHRWLRAVRAGTEHWVSAAAVASCVAAATMFAPVELQALERGTAVRRLVPDHMARLGVERALVFANELTAPWTGETWALAPPPPSPRLDDRILYVRRIGTPADQVELWQRRFPDRSPWVVELVGGRATLRPLVREPHRKE